MTLLPVAVGADRRETSQPKTIKAYMLYEIAVKTLPSHSEQLEGKPEKLALGLTQVIAESDQGAILRAGVENAKALAGVELSRAVVILRRVG